MNHDESDAESAAHAHERALAARTAGKKTPQATDCVMTQIVLPGDSNALGTAFGGRIMQWIDLAAAIACQRHCRSRVVTASIDDVQFLAPVKMGMAVELRARVNAAFKTSMEAGVRIESENPISGERRHVCTAYLTFVSIEEGGGRLQVPPLLLETEDDQRRNEDAQRRRSIRLEKARYRRERDARRDAAKK
jgi:acyl-CoA hydrolase